MCIVMIMTITTNLANMAVNYGKNETNDTSTEIWGLKLDTSFSADVPVSNFSTDDEKTARLIEMIVSPVILTFGSIGNIMSFVILRSGDLKKISTCFYMSVLAVIDTGRSLS